MILEVALLNIKIGKQDVFEQNFEQASKIISAMKGYINHKLKKCIEQENQYILLLNWNTLEDYELDFRKSPEYQEWKKLAHHFYEPFPQVLHHT